MASLPDTSSPTPTPIPTPTPTPTKRLGEPSLGYRTATICALVLGGMVLLAFLVTLIAFRRALINKCIKGRYYPKTPPSSSLPRSHSQYEQGSSDGGGTGSVRQMEKVRVRVGRRDMEARVEVSPYRQQHRTLSAVIVEGAVAWPETGTGPGPDSGFEAGSEAGAGGGGGGGVRGSGETQNRRSQDSTTSSIQSTHTCASTLVVVPSTTTPSFANTSIGTAENGMKRRSLWQDILQAFKGSRKHNPTNTISAATTPTTTESPSAVVSRSASIVAVHHLPITTTTTTIDASIAPSSPITPHQEAVIASAASVYSQAFSVTSPVSPTNLPPIIYCPRERAELDQLRQKYPTAAPGYTTYRHPPPPTPLDRELTAPTSTIPMTTTIAISGSPSRPRSRASTFGLSTSPTRVTFADMGANSNTQRNKRTSSAAPIASHSNRTSVISTTTTTIAPSLATTPISPRARQIPTSASLPTFLTSPFLLHNRPTTPALAPASTPPAAQTPSSSSSSFSRKPKTLRAFLPTIADPTQSENHISNYFTRNSRPYSPFSYPKIYAPSYGDVEDLPQISSIPSSPTLHDSGAGVGSGFGGFGSGVSTTSNRNST